MDMVKSSGHLFQKGKSGNPAGRPKGSKNQLTIMRIALEGELRAQLGPQMAEVLAKAIEMAKQGDQAMIKLLVDKALSTTKTTDDEPQREKIQIIVGRMDNKEEKTVIDGRTIKED